MLRIEITDPDAGAFALSAGNVADPSIASRFPLDAHRVVADRRAWIDVRAMCKSQKLELLAGVVAVAARNDFQRTRWIRCVRVAAPRRDRKIVGHERSHVPVVRN